MLDHVALAQQTTSNGEKESFSNDISNFLKSGIVQFITSVSALIAAVITGIIATLLKHKSDQQIQIGGTLRQKRIDVYSKLFDYMYILAIIPKQPEIKSYQDLENFQEEVTKWYYREEGGLLMSTSCQGAYIDLQNCINKILEEKKDKEFEICEIHKEILRKMGYILRLHLLKDVGIDVSQFELPDIWLKVRLKAMHIIPSSKFKKKQKYKSMVKTYATLFGKFDDELYEILSPNHQDKSSNMMNSCKY